MNDGYLYGRLGDGGYNAVHRGAPHQIHKRITPNFEKKEGLRFGPFVPAPYLPSIRLEQLNYDHFVIAAGMPCAVESNGFAVPAGYRLLLALGADQGPRYSAEDVIAGVRNAAGTAVVEGEYVVNSMLSEDVEVGRCVGVASYDVYMQLNSDPHNPGSYKYHNYNKQNSFAILTNYLLEFPIEPLKRSANTIESTLESDSTVLDLGHDTVVSHHIILTVNKDRVEDFTFAAGAGAGGVDQLQGLDLKDGDIVKVSYLYEESYYSSPFPGMTTWRGDAEFTGLVTFDKDSKFVLYSAADLDDTDTASLASSVSSALDAEKDIIGIVTNIDKEFPKQMLDAVKTAYDPRLYSPIINPETGEYTDGSGLDRMPGSATDGVPHAIQYAGGDLKTGVVTFKLKL